MATINTYDLNGTATDFPVDFEYLARKFVKVVLRGPVIAPRTLNLVTEFVFTNPTQIRTLSPWGNGDGYTTLEIRRETSATDRIVTFQDATVLRASDLNTAELQTLHIAEEARDSVTDVLGLNAEGNPDARLRRIVNVADPVDPGDVVTKRFYDADLGGVVAARAAAEAAQAAAVQAALESAANAINAQVLRVELAAAGGSGIVGFQQDAVGSVPRTMLSKGRERVSVADFGDDVGTGGDDTAAIQRALNALPNGGELEFPQARTLLVSAELVPRGGTTLTLNGSTLKQKAGSNMAGMFFINSLAPNVYIRNGTIDINVQEQVYVSPRGDTGRGIFAYQAVGLRVHNVRFRNPYGSYILMAACTKGRVTRCDVRDTEATGHYAIELNSCSDVDVTHNTGRGSSGLTGYGIYVHGPSQRVAADDNNFTYWQIVQIGDNYLLGGGTSTMLFCSVSRNRLMSPSADTSIHFGRWCAVNGNFINGSMDVGISVDYCRNTTINDNTINVTNASGIAMPGCIDCVCAGNSLSDVGSQFYRPVFAGLRCGIWVPQRSDENNVLVTPSGNVLVGNTIMDRLGVPQMYFGISVADVGGVNVNYVAFNYIEGAIGKALEVPPQTNQGYDQTRRFLELRNGWSNVGLPYPSLSYFKDENGTVWVEGVITAGASGGFATLPVGFRPKDQILRGLYTNSGMARADVFPNGDISMSPGGGNGFVSVALSFTTR